MREAKHWIAGAIHHPGALHRALGVKPGDKISEKKMMAASHSKSPKIRKEVALARTLEKMHRKG
jgi:hypothetical protein